MPLTSVGTSFGRPACLDPGKGPTATNVVVVVVVVVLVLLLLLLLLLGTCCCYQVFKVLKLFCFTTIKLRLLISDNSRFSHRVGFLR